MTPRTPYQDDAVSNRWFQPKNHLKFEAKQTPGPLFHHDIPPKNMIIRYYKGSDDPYQVDAVSNRLFQTKNTLNWLAGVSETNKSKA